MKILKLLILVSCSFSTCCYGISHLKPGIYSLEGSNDKSGNINYRGSVIIQPSGELYELVWIIGSRQAQVGTGILQGDVLSVNYYDVNSGSSGVVSYRVISENMLVGKWAPVTGTSYGREFLKYISSGIFE